MTLNEVYHRCGLINAKLFERQAIENSMFDSKELMTEVIGKNRRRGQTTNLMMWAIKNVFDQKTTVIAVINTTLNNRLCLELKKYVKNFPELDLSWYAGTITNEFVGTTVNRNRIFVATYVSESERNVVMRARRYDVEYLDY